MNRRYFRVVIPTNVDQLLALADKILQKHYLDGLNSQLPPTLIDQLQNKIQIARNAYTRQQELDRQKEKCNEKRNLILGLHDTQNSYTAGTIYYFVTAIRDNLLGRYRGSERQLGDWGFTINSPKGSVQVLIPTNADQLIALTKRIQQKHYQDGNNSPLQNMDWSQLDNLLLEAEQKLEEGRKANRDKETATQARNLALGTDKTQTSKTPNTIKYLVKSIRDILLGVFRGREQELGNWGFEVNASGIRV